MTDKLQERKKKARKVLVVDDKDNNTVIPPIGEIIRDENNLNKRRQGFLARILNFFETKGGQVDVAGRKTSHFFSAVQTGSGRFKHNQRKERSLSRRRKMKPGAR